MSLVKGRTQVELQVMKLHARLDVWDHLVVHQIISYVYQVLVSP